MRFATNILLSFLIAALATLVAATSGLWATDGEGIAWLVVVAGIVIPCISLYLLQAWPWSEWVFQWFFWLGCFCLAVGCVRAWEAFRYAPVPSESPWEWSASSEAFIYARVFSSFSAAFAGLVFTGIALIQDHSCGCRRWIRKSRGLDDKSRRRPLNSRTPEKAGSV